MFLFILESIGTSELILIGIIALIFLGPRKLPSIARTIGKTLADFRNTTNEFKSTWEREVNFEEEANAIKTGDLNDSPVPWTATAGDADPEGISAPEIKEIDAAAFDDIARDADNTSAATEIEEVAGETTSSAMPPAETSLSDKKNWL